jgi:hypothetical protein
MAAISSHPKNLDTSMKEMEPLSSNKLEESDPSYREQFSDNDNALDEVDQFALDTAFALCGGEEFVRGVIESAPQWLDEASIDMFDEKIQAAFDSGELSSLEEVFAGLVAQYLEAVGYNNEEGFADDAFDPEGEYEEYEGFDPDEDYSPDPELEEKQMSSSTPYRRGC